MAANGTSFGKGRSGNPAGSAQGSRNRATTDLDAMLERDAKAITQAAIDLAKKGHPVALKACLDRIAPVRRDRPIAFELPPIVTAADLPRATNALLAAVAAGELTPLEAEALGKLVDAHVRAIEAVDLNVRLAKLEQAQGRR